MIGKVAMISEDKRFIYIELEQETKLKLNQPVEVSRKHAKRSLQQNSFYWSYLTWCIKKGGLMAQGHFSIDALHEDIKAWIKQVHKKDFNEEFTTANLNKIEFAEYFNLVDYELMTEFFGVNTSHFHRDYEKYQEWLSYNPDGSFKQFLDV
ncbi:MAG: hypothetical protein ACP5N7_02365 [Candidatus Pacearchaeota archaeon]